MAASTIRRSGAFALTLGFLLSNAVFATPFILTAQLTGDPRTANPDNLIVDVTVIGDTTNATVHWTVDINSPLHPNAKLDEFYGNLALAFGQGALFSNVSPGGWLVDAPATTAGGGGIDFHFEATDPPPLGDHIDVTNSQNLTFDMTLLVGGVDAGFFDPTILTGALASCSNDAILGCGRLGAHLQSLTPVGNQTSDSGFVLGNWGDRLPPTGVPEPGSLALLGAALLGLVGARRCRKS